MRVGRVISNVLRILLMCLIVGSTFSWAPNSANASSTSHLLDAPVNFNLSQNSATKTSPIVSQPVSSPAAGTWEVIDTIQLSGTERPLQIAISGGKAYVSRNPGHLTILDLSTNAVITNISFDPYPSSTPQYIGISEGKAYVALSNLGSDGQLAVINTADNAISGYIPVGADPHGVAAFGQKVYVTNNVWWSSGDPATVKVVDTNTNSVVATISVGINPTSIAVDPGSGKAYVTNRNDLSKTVSVIDTNTNSVIATIAINNPPAGVAISDTRAYITTVVNMPNGTVEVIDIGADNIVSSIPVGRDSWGIAAYNDYVFVANQSSDTVSVIDVATNSVVATVNVGDAPTGIAVDPSTNRVYVTNQGDRTISIIEFKEEAQPSNQPPTVSIASPSNNATVSGIINIQGTASDPDGSSQLQMVEVKIDAGTWVQASGTSSWSYSWDTMAFPNGQHSIYARSYDGQAYSSEGSIVVGVNNVAPTPSLVDVGISSEAEAWPPITFLQAKPGDRFNTWYRIRYANSLIRVKLKTTIIDPNGREISNPLNDPFLQIDGPTEDTDWIGVTFEVPVEAILGTYGVKFSVWSEDGAQEYDTVLKSGWLMVTDQQEVQLPTAYIDSISPDPATQGKDTIFFTGHGTDPDGFIVTRNWRSSLDGQLSASSSFSELAFELSVGTHTIYFKVQDDDGLWSLEVTQVLTINPPTECIVTIVSGPEANPVTVDSHGSAQLSVSAADSLGHSVSYGWTATGGSFDSANLQYPIWYAPGNTSSSIEYYTLTVTATCGQGNMVSENIQVGVRPEEALPTDDVYWLAKAIMSEASIGTQEEQVAVGWTVLNRLESGKFGDDIEDIVKGGYVYNQEPTQEIVALAKDLLERRISDSTAGATHFFSPISMPKEGESTKGFDVGGGLHEVQGIIKRVYFPSWAETFEWIGDLHNVRRTHFMFYCEPSPTLPVPPQYLGEQATTLSEYYSAWGKELPLLSERAKMYEALRLGSVGSYSGTAEQNTRLLNVLKEKRICPSTANEISGVVPANTIAQLIEQEATGGVPVTVDGQFYIILTLANHIDPITLEVVPDSGLTEVYVYGDRNYPVAEREIARRIGIIELARKFQQDSGSSKKLGQKSYDLTDVWLAYKNVEFEDEAVKIVNNWFSTTPGLGWIMDKITSWIKQSVWDPLIELRERADGDIETALDDYASAQRIARNEIEDYQVAHGYLEAVWQGEVYQDIGTSLLYNVNRVGESKLERIRDYFVRETFIELLDLIFQGGAEAVVSFIEMDLEAVGGTKWEKDYEEEKGRAMSDVDHRLTNRLWLASSYTLELAQSPRLAVEVHSPVELRVYDSQGRVTGVVDGEERNEIPYSVYHDNSVTIFSPTDFYRYVVFGTSEGSYDLAVTTIAEETSTFSLTKVPTSTKAMHQYTIDWDALAKGKKGVKMKIDSDGDGTFEDIEYLGQEGIGFSWIWVALAGLSGLLGIFAGAFIVWRRMSKKQTA